MADIEVQSVQKSEVKKIISDARSFCSFEEIMERTHLSAEELTDILIKLRQSGFRTFQCEKNNDVFLCSSERYVEENNYIQKIENNGYPLKILINSDYHKGSAYDKPKFEDAKNEFEIKNNIKYEINLGDYIEGYPYHTAKTYPGKLRYQPSLENELRYLNTTLMVNPQVSTFLLYGNHDIFTLNGISRDFLKDYEAIYRKTGILPCGIEDTKFQINNDFIRLVHKNHSEFTTECKKIEFKYENQLIFGGHSHIANTEDRFGYHLEVIPTLSGLEHKSNNGLVFYNGFLVVTLIFDENKLIKEAIMDPYRLHEGVSEPEHLPSNYVEVRRYKNK
ncbi:MAG: hypothetical protein K6G37_01670 [Bacilli bacterium]|nr:hypothetical protein [Bacilli bacterium]